VWKEKECGGLFSCAPGGSTESLDQIGKGRADEEIPLHHNLDPWNIQTHAK
jgi:hypothetical protein